jgi:DNA-binding beta-propeller fold protein YncE
MNLHRSLSLAALAAWLLALSGTAARAAETKAFALTTDFQTGSLTPVALDTRAATLDVASIGSDAMARWYQGLLYVVNRFGGDNVQVIDPAQNYLTVRQFSVGNGSNPQDIAFVSPTKAYVSRYGSASLLIVNPATGATGPSISLAGFADGDGLPEMARMVRMERWLFVACQRLTNFQASNDAVIVVVDTQADTVLDVDPGTPGVQGIPLTLRNPVTAFALDRARGRLLIGCAGMFGALDGGVEAIDPVAFSSLGVVLTETALGGDISDVLVREGGHGYALVTHSSSNALVSWDPVGGAVLDTLHTASGGFSLPDFEANDRNELWVCQNDFTQPGLLVFDMTTDLLVAGPINTGLPPVSVTFDGATDAVTGVPVPTAPASITLSRPFPNPSRGPVALDWIGPVGAHPSFAVLDAQGRLVRRLASAKVNGGRVTWDLRSDRGEHVSPGVYFIVEKSSVNPAGMRRLVVMN